MTYYNMTCNPENVFSREQILAIENIIDQRLGLAVEGPGVTTVDYHTIPEIRQLIQDNLPSLVSFLGPDDFDIAVLRHVLSRKTTLRDGDFEITDNNSITRWEKQVLGAVSNDNWTNAPIVRGSRHRTYKFPENIYNKFSI
jgi:hypothetical protein